MWSAFQGLWAISPRAVGSSQLIRPSSPLAVEPAPARKRSDESLESPQLSVNVPKALKGASSPKTLCEPTFSPSTK